MASLFQTIGFSLEIGALAAGITLSVSHYAYEMSSRLRPLRDFFIVIFFILLGVEMNFSGISNLIFPVLILSIFVCVVKPFIVLITMNTLGYRTRTGFLTGMSLSQVSEFSLIMMTLAASLNFVNKNEISLITLTAVITIAVSTYVIGYGDNFYKWIKHPLKLFEWKKSSIEENENKEEIDMIIFGYDRVGSDFVDVAKKIHSSYIVVDFNPALIKRMHKENIPSRFGDAEDIEFLEEINLHKAKIVVSTIPDIKANKLLVHEYRKKNKEGIILTVSHDGKQAKELYDLGATYVIIPHYIGAHHASYMISKHALDIEFFNKERERHLHYISKK